MANLWCEVYILRYIYWHELRKITQRSLLLIGLIICYYNFIIIFLNREISFVSIQNCSMYHFVLFEFWPKLRPNFWLFCWTFCYPHTKNQGKIETIVTFIYKYPSLVDENSRLFMSIELMFSWSLTFNFFYFGHRVIIAIHIPYNLYLIIYSWLK